MKKKRTHLFMQPCFIQVCNRDLIAFLELLGYKLQGKMKDGFGIFANKGKYKICYTNEQPSIKDKDFIQCYDNIELFKALVALDASTPDFQWFLWEHNDGEYHPEDDDSWKQYIPGEHWQEWWWFEVRKATAEEIVEHFNKK